ncbi:MAG: c-type cytochrome [Candidatus Entotheonellia bacterium]
MNLHLYRYLLAVVVSSLLGAAVSSMQAQSSRDREHGGHASPQQEPAHGEHGTPEGWKFTWPRGDPVKGREVFVKLECYGCHEVQAEKFPAPSGDIGPELSMMGPLHDAEYFAEAIIHPNAVIQKGKGYEAADGASKMPSYNDLVTVQEVIDLVAYLKGLKLPVPKPAGHGRSRDSDSEHDAH